MCIRQIKLLNVNGCYVMIDTHTGRRTLNLTAIQQTEFCPPAPARKDAPHHLPQQVRELLRTAGSHPLSGFYTEPVDTPNQQALVIVLSCSSADEQVVAVFDTLTHMHKHDLEPFILTRHHIEGRAVHYGRFVIDANLRCTLESVRTTEQELAGIATRAQWKGFFGRAQPLYPLLDTGLRRQAIVEPSALELADASALAFQSSHSALLAGLEPGECVRVELFAPNRADKLLIVCDGQVYLRNYPLWPAVSHLNQILFASAPCAVLFLDPAEQLERDRFLGCEGYLSQWLTSTGLPWAGTHMPLPAAGHCVIAGSSLGGLAAAQTVKNIPGTVAKAVVQSGSFWWHKQETPGEEGEVLQQWLEAPLSPTIEIFHEVGHNEGYLLGWNLAFHEVLTERTVNHTHRIYKGGHDYACWRQGIVDALTHFFASAKLPNA